MKVELLQAIADQIKTVIDSVFIYSPELELNSKTRPFAVVRSITDMEAIATFNKTKDADYYVWVYVYPESNEYKALRLPEEIRTALFTELTVNGNKTLPLSITINRLNGTENDLEKYGSVITCIYRR